MESRNFITEASQVIRQLKKMDRYGGYSDDTGQLQRRIDQLLSALQNPTLPSAFNLMEAALSAGFTVDRRHQQRIRQFF